MTCERAVGRMPAVRARSRRVERRGGGASPHLRRLPRGVGGGERRRGRGARRVDRRRRPRSARAPAAPDRAGRPPDRRIRGGWSASRRRPSSLFVLVPAPAAPRPRRPASRGRRARARWPGSRRAGRCARSRSTPRGPKPPPPTRRRSTTWIPRNSSGSSAPGRSDATTRLAGFAGRWRWGRAPSWRRTTATRARRRRQCGSKSRPASAPQVQQVLGLTDQQALQLRATLGVYGPKRRAMEREERAIKQGLQGQLRPGIAAERGQRGPAHRPAAGAEGDLRADLRGRGQGNGEVPHRGAARPVPGHAGAADGADRGHPPPAAAGRDAAGPRSRRARRSAPSCATGAPRATFLAVGPEWRNGRRNGLKIRRGQPRASSTLASGTSSRETT